MEGYADYQEDTGEPTRKWPTTRGRGLQTCYAAAFGRTLVAGFDCADQALGFSVDCCFCIVVMS